MTILQADRAMRGGVSPPGSLLRILGVAFGLAVLVGNTTFDPVLALLAFLFVTNYALTFTGLFVSRRRTPNAVRPFRVPGYPLVPAAALAGSLMFMGATIVSDRTNSVLAVILVGLSWPVYRLARRSVPDGAQPIN